MAEQVIEANGVELCAESFGDLADPSVLLVSTSIAVSSDRAVPPSTAEFGRFVATVEVDWSDPESVIEYLVDYLRVLAGGERAFDEAGFRALAGRDVARERLPGRAEPRPVARRGSIP